MRFALRKATFCLAKDGLLDAERPCIANCLIVNRLQRGGAWLGERRKRTAKAGGKLVANGGVHQVKNTVVWKLM